MKLASSTHWISTSRDSRFPELRIRWLCWYKLVSAVNIQGVTKCYLAQKPLSPFVTSSCLYSIMHSLERNKRNVKSFELLYKGGNPNDEIVVKLTRRSSSLSFSSKRENCGVGSSTLRFSSQLHTDLRWKRLDYSNLTNPVWPAWCYKGSVDIMGLLTVHFLLVSLPKLLGL